MRIVKKECNCSMIRINGRFGEKLDISYNPAVRDHPAMWTSLAENFAEDSAVYVLDEFRRGPASVMAATAYL